MSKTFAVIKIKLCEGVLINCYAFVEKESEQNFNRKLLLKQNFLPTTFTTPL